MKEACNVADMTARHPCYSSDARHQFARMHLPVAPACNISCNYCNRKYDCVNESRPGVTSEVLSPAMALAKFQRVKQQIPQLSVAGIAGPGDALANWPAVRESIRLLQAAAPETIFCLSTNGLMLPDYGQEIIGLGVKHVTVTVNCIEPAIGAKIYRRVSYQGQHYVGEAAAATLLANQLAGIRLLAAAGILVKVNMVMIRGINDSHLPQVVKMVKDLGAFMTNIMPLIPAPGSVFQSLPPTGQAEVDAMRDLCEADIRQMRHCRQCRADAIGLLDEDRSCEFRSGAVKKMRPCSEAQYGLPGTFVCQS